MLQRRREDVLQDLLAVDWTSDALCQVLDVIKDSKEPMSLINLNLSEVQALLLRNKRDERQLDVVTNSRPDVETLALSFEVGYSVADVVGVVARPKKAVLGSFTNSDGRFIAAKELAHVDVLHQAATEEPLTSMVFSEEEEACRAAGYNVMLLENAADSLSTNSEDPSMVHQAYLWLLLDRLQEQSDHIPVSKRGTAV